LAGAYVIKLAENDLQRVDKELIAAGMLEPRDHALFGLSGTAIGDEYIFSALLSMHPVSDVSGEISEKFGEPPCRYVIPEIFAGVTLRNTYLIPILHLNYVSNLLFWQDRKVTKSFLWSTDN
jgi:hypothetical protein